MKSLFALLSVALLVFFMACDDATSSLDSLSYVDEDGNEVSIDISTGSFKDPRDGKKYSTVTVGDYTWMSENLCYEGEPVGEITDCKYGYSAAQVACPDGWHLSTPSEWRELYKVIENVYGDSAGWALKSTSGWDRDTVDDEPVSGNGGDILGFNIKPTGICRGSDCRYEGQMAGFWTLAKVDRDGYSDYVRFQSDPSTHGQDIYRDARLHVRCVSNENTMFELMGTCTEDKEGTVGVSPDSSYYTCRSLFWEDATLNEKVSFVHGDCDAAKKGKRVLLQDTSYMCAQATSISMLDYMMVYPTADVSEATEPAEKYEWTYTPRDTVFGDCRAKGDSICYYRDSVFVYHSQYWYAASVEEVYGSCTTKREGDIKRINKVDYVCRDSSWNNATDVEVEKGLCTDANVYDTTVYMGNKYMCVGKQWYIADDLEDSLGFCFSDGERGTFRNYEFICNGDDHKWYYEFKDARDGKTYKSVFFSYKLVMAENLKYGDDSLYTFHEAMKVDPECDTSKCEIDTLAQQGICPDGWTIMPEYLFEGMRTAYGYNKGSIKYADKWAFVPKKGWSTGSGYNRSGLGLLPLKVDTVKTGVTTYIDQQCKMNVPYLLISLPNGMMAQESSDSYCTRTEGGEFSHYVVRYDGWLSNSELMSVEESIYPADSTRSASSSMVLTTHRKGDVKKAAVRCVTDVRFTID